MPCTPERVWRAIEAARVGEVSDPWREPPGFFDHLAPPAGHLPDASDEEMDL
jgi:carbon-monoxide dehydrogenase large subunit